MLKELQSLDEATKKRVLVISTIIIMIIVVGIWLAYLNSIVVAPFAADQQAANGNSTGTGVPAPAGPSAAAPEPVAAGGPGFLREIGNFFAGIGRAFSGPSQYTIQPQQ